MILRRGIGWLAAMAYVVSGRRAAICRKVRRDGLVVPVLFHGPDPDSLDGILSGLDRLVGIENVDLTFDDGRKSIAQCIGVLEKYRIRAVCFISPGEILRGYNWAEHVQAVSKQADFHALCRMDAASREAVFEKSGMAGREGAELLSVREIRALSRHPLIEFGNHTWSHMSCTNRPVEEVLDEIARAQRRIREWTGAEPAKFSYPFGHDSPALDCEIRRLGLLTYSLRPGLVTESGRGLARNMAYDGMTRAENIGRLLTAWPGVKRMPS